MQNKKIYIDSHSGQVTVDMDILLTKTLLRDDENIRVQTTGHNYDFVATVENKTKNNMSIVFDNKSDYLPEFNLKANDWIGLMADNEGYETLEALTNGRFHIEEDI